MKKDFGHIIAMNVNILTRRKESYESYIRNVKLFKIATSVKMADLRDNLNVLRLSLITEKHMRRINKYVKAYRYLSVCED